ncbi:Hypothetical predicted protein [Lynx pardinus]|uniref:Uncharacterized protein n=1 Tax=Lynx pardinus TaxID=191816 RepID=A0A485PQX0_LYNPA|nr:Hypothetical predicted protein [Lynx pardinus]
MRYTFIKNIVSTSNLIFFIPLLGRIKYMKVHLSLNEVDTKGVKSKSEKQPLQKENAQLKIQKNQEAGTERMGAVEGEKQLSATEEKVKLAAEELRNYK